MNGYKTTLLGLYIHILGVYINPFGGDETSPLADTTPFEMIKST